MEGVMRVTCTVMVVKTWWLKHKGTVPCNHKTLCTPFVQIGHASIMREHALARRAPNQNPLI